MLTLSRLLSLSILLSAGGLASGDFVAVAAAKAQSQAKATKTGVSTKTWAGRPRGKGATAVPQAQAPAVAPKPVNAPAPVAPASWTAPGQDETEAREWRGERFAKKHGGLFVGLSLQQLAGGKGRIPEVRVIVTDIQQRETHLLRLDPSRLSAAAPGQMFIAATGKYAIKRIEVIDGSGIKRSWSGGDDSFKFAVKSYCLSNLGRWTFTPQGANGLAVTFESTPNTFKELGRSREDNSVAAVIDGTSGAVQAIFAGKKALFGATSATDGKGAPSGAGARQDVSASGQLAGLRLNEWHGEYFEKSRGAFFISLSLQNFRGGFTSEVQVYMTDLLHNNPVMVSLDPSRQPTSVAGQIWIAATGKYRLDKIELVDGTGAKRTWMGDADQQRYSVKKQCLSNLGRWIVRPQGADGLALTFEPIANPFKEQGKDRKDSSVAAVIDGKTGLVQEVFAGKKAINNAESDNSTTNELRRSITFTRQISMFYKLDLMRHNYHAKSIAAILNANDASVRRCYTDRLDFNDNLRGTLSFTFLLSKQSGTMAKLKHTGGSANDPKLAECVYLALSSMQFPVPDNMVGELVYTYDVK
ncbi:MAG: AgmX/PglI C-terminal domain-containing protein [Deltaproteobacteria bacterium]|nr:AgmX/PglI C-terminal domain-containing protein [Deltaproteobacteria bacterium]